MGFYYSHLVDCLNGLIIIRLLTRSRRPRVQSLQTSPFYVETEVSVAKGKSSDIAELDDQANVEKVRKWALPVST